MKPSVYLETTVVSYYSAPRSRDLIIAAHQQVTQDWWDTVLPKFDAYVSPFVINEISRGDEQLAQQRLATKQIVNLINSQGSQGLILELKQQFGK